MRVSILAEGLIAFLDLPWVGQDTLSKSQRNFSRVGGVTSDFFHIINTDRSFSGKLETVRCHEVGGKKQ